MFQNENIYKRFFSLSLLFINAVIDIPIIDKKIYYDYQINIIIFTKHK